MRLPNLEEAHVDRSKITEYLLNRNHPDAEGKSKFFFRRYGTEWKRLREDLLEHASGPVDHTEETRHGILYVIEDTLAGAHIRSVWMIRTGESFPRFITAYPIE